MRETGENGIGDRSGWQEAEEAILPKVEPFKAVGLARLDIFNTAGLRLEWVRKRMPGMFYDRIKG